MRQPQARAEVHSNAGEHATGQRHDRIAQDLRGFHIDAEDEQDGPPGDVSIMQKMGSAILGSVLTSLLVTPLDVVRVRLQSQQPTPTPSPIPSNLQHIRSTPSASFQNLPPNLGVTACCREVFWVNNNAPYCVASSNIAIVQNPTAGSTMAECAAEEIQRKTFTSTFDGLSKIARNEGITTLWRGLTPTLVMAVPGNVIYFAGYDWLRTNKSSPMQTFRVPDAYSPLVAGSTARVLAAIAISPIEMFRTRMQAVSSTTTGSSGHLRATLGSMQEMVSSDGYRSLWRGLGLTLWRDVPFSAIYWWGYEYGRNVLTDIRERGRPLGGAGVTRSRSLSRSQQNHTDTLVDSFISGAGSGGIAALVTTPFDVGKTRQQVVRHGGDSSVKRAAGGALVPEELSMPRFLLHIYTEQGMAGLFRGWAARCLKVAPACAIMISSYELGKKWAGGMNDRKQARTEDD